MSEKAPHVPAAFINAIAETGTKADAIQFLQLTWNDYCEARDAARRWYKAASPYATPEALHEALLKRPEAAARSKADEAIVEHNMGCKAACGKTTSYPHVRESRRCDSRRDCPDCPLDWMIDGFPSSRPQLPAEGQK